MRSTVIVPAFACACDVVCVRCFEAAEAAKDRCSSDLLFFFLYLFDSGLSVEVKTSHDSGKPPVPARVNELCKLGIDMYRKMLASFVMHDAKDIGRQDEDNTKCVPALP